MKSHTGIYMTLGKGATYTPSCKQKLNTSAGYETFAHSTRQTHTNYKKLPG